MESIDGFMLRPCQMVTSLSCDATIAGNWAPARNAFVFFFQGELWSLLSCACRLVAAVAMELTDSSREHKIDLSDFMAAL